MILYLTIITTILFCALDSILIKNNTQIDHWIETFAHFAIVFVVGASYNSTPLGLIYTVWSFLIVRCGIYDYVLNIFRGLPLNYTSKSTGSILDKIEQKTGLGEVKIRLYLFIVFCIYFIANLLFYEKLF